MGAYLKEIYDGCKSLLVGLGITFNYMLQPVVTLQYPHKTLAMTPRFRGHIDLVRDQAGNHKCIVCGLCQRNCPSECISLQGEKAEGAGKKQLTVYQLDFTRCSLCGICVESCPTNALTFSRDYNLAGLSGQEFIFDLLKGLEEKSK